MAPVAGNKRARESDGGSTATKKPKANDQSAVDNNDENKDVEMDHSSAEAIKQQTVDDNEETDAVEAAVPTDNTPSPFALRPVEQNIDDSQHDNAGVTVQPVPTSGSMLPPPVIPGKSRGRGSDRPESSPAAAAIAAVQASQAAAAAAAVAAASGATPTAPIDASSNPYLARYGDGQHPPPPPPPGYLPMPFMAHHNPYLANQFPMYIPHTGHMMPIPMPFDQSQYRPPGQPGANPQGASASQTGEGATEGAQNGENGDGANSENGNGGASGSNTEGGAGVQPVHPFPPPGFPHHHPFPTHMPPPEFLPNPNDPHNPHNHPHHNHLLPPMHHPHAPNTMQLTLPLAVADHALPSHLDALIRAPDSLTISYSEVPDGAYLLRSDFGEPYPKQLEPPRKTTEMRCLFCKRHYSGPNARGMWRRHVTGKHDFVFERKGKDSLPGMGPRRSGVGGDQDDDDDGSPGPSGPGEPVTPGGQSSQAVNTPGQGPPPPGMSLVGPEGMVGLMSMNGMPIHGTGQPNAPGTPGTPGHHPPPPPPHMMTMAYPYGVPFGHFPPGMMPPPPHHFGPPVTIDAKKPRTSSGGAGRGAGRSPNGVGMGNGGGGLVPRVHPLLSKEERIERARASKRHYAMKRRALEKMKQGGIPKGARLVDGVFILADGTQIPAEPGRVYTDLNAPSASNVHLGGGSAGSLGVGDEVDDDEYGKKRRRRGSRKSLSGRRRGKDADEDDEDEEGDELGVAEELGDDGLISMAEGGDTDHWNMGSNPAQGQGSGSGSGGDHNVQVGMATTTATVVAPPGSGKLAEVPIISRGTKPPPMVPHVMMQRPPVPVDPATVTATATATAVVATASKRGGAIVGSIGRGRGGRRKSAARIEDEMDEDPVMALEGAEGSAVMDDAKDQAVDAGDEPEPAVSTTTTRSGRQVKSSIQAATPNKRAPGRGRASAAAKKDEVENAKELEREAEKEKPVTISNLPPGIIPPGEDDEEDERRFCYCGDVEYGQMIGCDNGPNCPREWFHLACTDIEGNIPSRWFCKECRVSMEGAQEDPADTAESSVPAVVVDEKGKEKDKDDAKDKEEKETDDAEASAAIPTRGRPRRGRPPKSKAADEELPAAAPVTSTPPTSKRGGRAPKSAAAPASEKKEKEKEKEPPKGRRGTRGRRKSTAQAAAEAEVEDEVVVPEDSEEEEREQYESEDQGETVPPAPSTAKQPPTDKQKDPSGRRLDEDYDELDEMDVDMTGLVHVDAPAAAAAAAAKAGKNKTPEKGKADQAAGASGGRSTRSSAKRGGAGATLTASPGKTRSGKPLSSASASAPAATASNDMEVDELDS